MNANFGWGGQNEPCRNCQGSAGQIAEEVVVESDSFPGASASDVFAGIVIYTLDARGLVAGLPDAKVKRAPDMTGALAGAESTRWQLR